MTKEKKILTDSLQYQRDVAIKEGEYRPIQVAVDKLRKTGKDVPWDDLYNALDSGNLRDVLAKRFAQEQLMDWDDPEVKIFCRKRYNFIPTGKSFPKSFVCRQSDKSFCLSRVAIRECYRKAYERTIDEKQVEAIEIVCEKLNELKIHSNLFRWLFYTEGEKVKPNWEHLADEIGVIV